MSRVGYGYDCHRFSEGDHVWIGGIKIPHTHGVAAHSDGDVLLHALVDALLGAATLGDIGQHFPDTDPKFKDKPSAEFIRHTQTLLNECNLKINNIDSTILAEQPRILKHVPAMRANIAGLLDLPQDCINIKATTNEKMGWLGRGEGLAAQVVVLLR